MGYDILCLVGSGAGGSTLSRPVDVMKGAWGVQILKGVRAKVVSLSLQQVGWQLLGAVSVVKGQGRGEGWRGDAKKDGLGQDQTPALLTLG